MYSTKNLASWEDKSQVIALLEKLIQEDISPSLDSLEPCEHLNKEIVIDAMCVVHEVFATDEPQEIKTCSQFAKVYTAAIDRKFVDIKEVMSFLTITQLESLLKI